jgi:hypothetical protein
MKCTETVKQTAEHVYLIEVVGRCTARVAANDTTWRVYTGTSIHFMNFQYSTSATRRQQLHDKVVEIAARVLSDWLHEAQDAGAHFLVFSMYRTVSFFKYLSQEMLSHR